MTKNNKHHIHGHEHMHEHDPLNCDCDECDDTCDLNPDKICDSCGSCLGIDEIDYKRVLIDGMIEDENKVGEYIMSNPEFINAMGKTAHNENEHTHHHVKKPKLRSKEYKNSYRLSDNYYEENPEF